MNLTPRPPLPSRGQYHFVFTCSQQMACFWNSWVQNWKWHYPRTYDFFRKLTICQCQEIMVLFVLHKLILQTCMHSHQVGLDVWFFDRILRLLPYFMCTYSKSSGETARMRLRWSPMWKVPKSHELAQMVYTRCPLLMGRWKIEQDMFFKIVWHYVQFW